MSSRLSNTMTVAAASAIFAFVLFAGEHEHAFSAEQSSKQTEKQSEKTKSRDDAKPASKQEQGTETGVVVQASATISRDLIDDYIDVAKQIDPDVGERLDEMCKARTPAGCEEIMRVVVTSSGGQRLLSLVKLRDRDPDLYQLKVNELFYETQVRHVAAHLREAIGEGDTRNAEHLQKRLEQLLQIQLALSIKSRADHLCRLEEHIAEVRKEIEWEAEHFNETIAARIDNLLSLPDPNPSSVIPIGADDSPDSTVRPE